VTAEARIAPDPEPPILDVRDLRVWYRGRRGLLWHDNPPVRAVDGVSFSIAAGETLGLVGESGSGKTTIARSIIRVLREQSGVITFKGQDLTRLRGRSLRRYRRGFQMVFQDPYSSLDPHQTVRRILAEPLGIHSTVPKPQRNGRIDELLMLVGLDPSLADRYPHEFSGGQRQRIGIARALAVDPELLICDEPISSLDVSIRAQIINLLLRLQRELSLSYLFIAHDLAVVRQVADRIAVLYLGKVMEIGTNGSVLESPAHPYTIALISAVPRAAGAPERSRRIVLKGDIPSPASPPNGCRFHTRCWLRQQLGDPEICVTTEPVLESIGRDHSVACHFPQGRPSVRLAGSQLAS
jgi:oligopeptide/dipeptide ABC transporter ATP-binding protein